MFNSTIMTDNRDLPSLPSYTPTPLPPLLPPISDKALNLILPVLAYWAFSLLFHWIDIKDYFPQYRLHTPAEVAKRNRASRWEVVRDVIIQQVVQTVVALLLNMLEPEDVSGKEDYDIAVWARRIRMAERALPVLLSLVGINAVELGKNLGAGHPMLAGALLGGHYPNLQYVTSFSSNSSTSTSPFAPWAPWEMTFAKLIYYCFVPAVQFAIAIIFVDTWQYFLHRAMHMNKYLYTTFHSRHHRLYVPYAYGALYNHPFEGFLLDTLGASLAYKTAGMSTRQGMCFFTGSTLKTVDDHCGYALPWDPLQCLTSNNAGYHDVHHQSWGIKTNFSQPFFTFWDRILGTVWTGGDVSARYERSRVAAQKAQNTDTTSKANITGSDAEESRHQNPQPYEHDIKTATDLSSVPASNRQPQPPAGKAELQATGSRQQVLDDRQGGGASVLAEEAREEREAQAYVRRTSPRKRSKGSSSTRESFKGLSQRISTGSTCLGGLGA